ncbi:hypothetical protein P5G65_11250 [Paenibacillus chondroitinus]|uniref:Uncharacterized protein n=1 Tax=Paenibacillus chondroitinus TaxID=59842 RepID=A0ABU6DAI2_9BACL|nr:MULTISPECIES: hypothetical protein [Paenibacillus]MCY9656826.1 hypothetical protein [Paenibacillus anseongense]MEB4794476.1 hypothetical protein [Paenibacillus chondroitinus]
MRASVIVDDTLKFNYSARTKNYTVLTTFIPFISACKLIILSIIDLT